MCTLIRRDFQCWRCHFMLQAAVILCFKGTKWTEDSAIQRVPIDIDSGSSYIERAREAPGQRSLSIPAPPVIVSLPFVVTAHCHLAVGLDEQAANGQSMKPTGFRKRISAGSEYSKPCSVSEYGIEDYTGKKVISHFNRAAWTCPNRDRRLLRSSRHFRS
jgi:hypothetical protein